MEKDKTNTDNVPEEDKKKIIDRLCIKFRHQGYEEIKKKYLPKNA